MDTDSKTKAEGEKQESKPDTNFTNYHKFGGRNLTAEVFGRLPTHGPNDSLTPQTHPFAAPTSCRLFY
jgi:hypothetical protein